MYAFLFLAVFLVAGLDMPLRSTGSGRLTLVVESNPPETVVKAGAGVMLAWGGLDRSESPSRNLCYLSQMPALGDDEEPFMALDHHELFVAPGELGTCCAGRMTLAPTGAGRSLAVTTCSGRSGTWLWSQAVSATGDPLEVAAPVLPIPGRSQEVPRLVAAGGGRSWLSWVEREGSAEAGGVLRVALLDGTGEPVLGPADLSSLSLGAALGGHAFDSLHSAYLAGSGLAVAWLARGGDGGVQIRFRLIEPEGRPSTPEIVATPDDHAPRNSFRIHAEDDGGVTLLWTRRGPSGKPDRVFLRRFAATGEPRSDAVPIAADERKRAQLHPRIVRVGTSEWVVWSEWPSSSSGAEGWIAVRRWSPEVGPIGLTTRFPATFAPYGPLLEAVPDDAEGAFTLFWHADPNGFADPGRLAWRRVVVPDAR